MRRVRVKNFKSIAGCDVTLGPVNVLVGRNGSGKSNFLEALDFLIATIGRSLDDALQARGGFASAVHRGAADSDGPGVRVWLNLQDGSEADYGFELGAVDQTVYVRRERLEVRRDGQVTAHFDIVRDSEEVNVQISRDPAPLPRPDRLYLEAATSFAEFRPVLAGIESLAFYDPAPNAVRKLQPSALSEDLDPDAGNLAAIVGRLERKNPAVVRRIEQYLQTIVPHIAGVRRVVHDVWETLEFRQDPANGRAPWTFNALSMSDGTLRALAILVALQGAGDRRARCIGIEEPETALHPAAVGALLDALREASAHTQVVVTTHSADLLDRLDLAHEQLLVAHSTGEATNIALADPASRDAIKGHLFGAGELLRMDQLEVDPKAATSPVGLFDEAEP